MKRAARGKPVQGASTAISSRFSARVVATHGRHFFIETAAGELLEAVRRGKRGDVVVGDQVECSPAAPGQAAIEAISARTSLLYRSDEFRTKELAANIDQVAVVFASRPSFNPWFIWKALLAAEMAGIAPLVIRNKCELEDGAAAAAAFVAQLQGLGYDCVSVSAKTQAEDTLERLGPRFSGRATLLVGQSGMGKSTLLNLLVPEANARTQEYSQRLNLGKQTTTTSRWFPLALNAEAGAVVDSPGFQEFGLAHLDRAQIAAAMPDIARWVGECRFLDCRHLDEPNCGVKNALSAGEIAPERYEFYRALALQAGR